MNMLQEPYNKEVKRQIKNVQKEIDSLQKDYESCPDFIVQSQIKTFLEKKEFLLLNLMERENGIIR